MTKSSTDTLSPSLSATRMAVTYVILGAVLGREAENAPVRSIGFFSLSLSPLSPLSLLFSPLFSLSLFSCAVPRSVISRRSMATLSQGWGSSYSTHLMGEREGETGREGGRKDGRRDGEWDEGER